MARPILCYVTDRQSLKNHEEIGERIRLAVAAGVEWIQIREKDMATRELLALARKAVGAAAGSNTKILINDRLDVAVAVGAAGVHLGGASLPVRAVNSWRRGGVSSEVIALRSAFMIGTSCHSLDAALAAERDGADYILFGPVFATPSKADFGAPQGINRLAEVSKSVKIPVLAIGGVNAENIHECGAAGAAGIAAIRMFQEARDLAELVGRLGR